MKKIIVSVSRNGDSKLRVEGCQGPACETISGFLDAVLGQKVAEEHTQDYYTDPPLTNEVEQPG